MILEIVLFQSFHRTCLNRDWNLLGECRSLIRQVNIEDFQLFGPKLWCLILIFQSAMVFTTGKSGKWLLGAPKARSVCYDAVCHGCRENSALTAEHIFLLYYMTPVFLKNGESIFHRKNGVPFLKEKLCHMILGMFTAQRYCRLWLWKVQTNFYCCWNQFLNPTQKRLWLGEKETFLIIPRFKSSEIISPEMHPIICLLKESNALTVCSDAFRNSYRRDLQWDASIFCQLIESNKWLEIIKKLSYRSRIPAWP